MPFIRCFSSTEPSKFIIIASPGLTSFKTSKPKDVIALLSDANRYEPLWFFPRASGLIPFGSLNATKPIPEINATTAYPPWHWSKILFKTSSISLLENSFLFVLNNSYDKSFNNTSESEFVLNWQKFY